MTRARGTQKRRRPSNGEADLRQSAAGSGGAVGAIAKPTILFALAMLVIAFVAFGPAIAAPFDFDDGPTVIGNTTIRTAWPPSALIDMPRFGTPVSGRPVANYSFALTYAVNRWFGFNSATWAMATNQTVAYHVTNVLLHAATAVLLFALIAFTMRVGNFDESWRSRANPIAATIALLWLLHPLQTEAVDYVAQRTELLVSFFYLATLYGAARAWPKFEASTRSRLRWLILAVVACVLGMLSKEVMIGAPIAVILFDRAFFADGWRQPWRDPQRRVLYIALIASAAIPVALTVAGARGGTAGFGTGMPWYVYLRSQGWAIPHYLRLTLVPVGLTIDYGQRPVGGAGTLLGLIVLAVVAGLVIAAWRRSSTRWLAFLGGLFFLLLAPSSSIVPINTEIAAERRVYLALAPVIVALVIACEWAWTRYAPATRTRVKEFIVVAIAVIFATLTFRRSAMYVDPASLWADAAARVPTNARAFDNLAAADIRGPHPNLARDDSLAAHAIALDSTFVPSWARRAGIAISEDRLEDAKRLLHHALSIKPDEWSSMEQLGRVYNALGQADSAIVTLRRVVTNSPSSQAFADLGAAYLSASKLDSATSTLIVAVSLDSLNLGALSDLGASLVEQGSGAQAVPYLDRAVQLDPTPGFDLGLLSLALALAGRVGEAHDVARNAVSVAPHEVPVLVFVGRAMLAAHDPNAAVTYLTQAVQSAPTDPQGMTWLAMATAASHDSSRARALLERALTIAPGYPLAESYRKVLDRR